MDLKGFTDLGNNISRRVNDSVHNMNFNRLEQDIRREINQAFGMPERDQYHSDFGGLNGKLYRGAEEEPDVYSNSKGAFRSGPNVKNSVNTAVGPVSVPIISKVPGKGSSILMMVAGYGLSGVLGVGIVAMGILSLTFTMIGTVPASIVGAIAGGLVPFFIAGVVLAVLGTKRYGRINRFKQYLIGMKGAKFCAIKDLAKKIGKSPKFVCRDLSKMIDHGFFPEGHIDDQWTCFIGTDQMYVQYIQARDSAMEREKSGAENEKQNSAIKQDHQLEKVIAEGEAYIKTIREANDAIYNPDISQKLYRMETIVEKIFDYVRKNSGQMDQLRRFMSYYMPMTEKLVKAYKDFDEQTIQGENIKKAKEEIARTLDTINEAYEKLYDSMYIDMAMDVTSDISVLKTLFAQEGLMENDINGGKK